MREGTFYLHSDRTGHTQATSLHPIIKIMSCKFLNVSRPQALRVISALALGCAVSFAAKQFVMPTPHPAKTYPAHEEHSDEGVTVAFDPYDMADKASIFSVHYGDVAILPVFVVISNEGDQPVSLAEMKAEFVTVDRTKISPATTEDLYRRLSHPEAGTKPSPIPWPKKPKGAVSKQAQEEIENSQFVARAVEPHGIQAGFMFFDVVGVSTPLAGGHIYLTGLRDARGHELFYFDVPMEKYLSAPTKPN
jgi:hypothetical protein